MTIGLQSKKELIVAFKKINDDVKENLFLLIKQIFFIKKELSLLGIQTQENNYKNYNFLK